MLSPQVEICWVLLLIEKHCFQFPVSLIYALDAGNLWLKSFAHLTLGICGSCWAAQLLCRPLGAFSSGDIYFSEKSQQRILLLI
jgi:hypothetical protein